MVHRVVFARDDKFYDAHAQSSTGCLGHPCAGGTTAYCEALWMARNTALPDAEARGVSEALRSAAPPPGGGEWVGAVVLCSELAHYSVSKAVGIIGLGTEHVISVPVTEALKGYSPPMPTPSRKRQKRSTL